MNPVPLILFALAAYLLGAIPFGFLIARMKGVRIQDVGSGNIGATNVFRCVGKGWGLLTFFCDALKGFLAAFALPALLERTLGIPSSEGLAATGALLAVIGHNWPVFLGFKGGKGVATSAGALLGVAQLPVAVALGVWLLVFFAIRYVSVASMLAAVSAAATALWMHLDGRYGLLIPVMLTALAGLTVWRHRGNIQRLREGTEHRIQFRKPRKASGG